MLAGPSNNGGFTPTCALLPMSPAIDSGDDAACPATDQRGVRRPQGLHCDVGAFELMPQLTIIQEPSGGMVLSSKFAAATLNEVLTSTNLTDWAHWASSFADTNGVALFKDMALPLPESRFYQLRIRPGQ